MRDRKNEEGQIFCKHSKATCNKILVQEPSSRGDAEVKAAGVGGDGTGWDGMAGD